MVNEFKKIGLKIKGFNKNVSYVHRKTKRLRLFIFFDMLWCKIRYLITSTEYRVYEFYFMKNKERKHYLSKATHNFYQRFLCPKKLLHMLNNKENLYTRLNNYMRRNVIDITDIHFKDFDALAKTSEAFICREKEGSVFKSYKIYSLKDYRSPAFLSEKIKDDKKYLIEKKFEQHKLLKEISDEYVFVNFVTVFNNNRVDVISSSIKFRDGSLVITGHVDLKNNCVEGKLKVNKIKDYGTLENYQLPKLDRAIKLVKECAKELSEIKEIEWSVCFNKRGDPYLMDARLWHDVIFAQVPNNHSKKKGLKKYYKELMRKI